MTRYIIIALWLLSTATISKAQTLKPDTLYLSVFNTGTRLQLTQADFGGNITQDLIGTMARAFDTVMVMKQGTSTDSTGKKRMEHQAERRANKISKDLKDKIVVIELNKDVDVTETCINIQRGGAKALILIHNSDKKEEIKMKKLGKFKDSLRIPCFTVRSGVGDSLLTLLPSVGYIKSKTVNPQSLAANNAVLGIEAQAEYNRAQIEWVNNTGDQNDYFIVQKLNPLTGIFEDMVTVNNHAVTGLEHYNSFDNEPIDGENTYRIKLVMLDGTQRYSEPKTVNFYSANNISIFPNPTDDALNISFKGYTGQAVDLFIFDMQGKSILTQHLEKVQNTLHSIPIGEKAIAGEYMLRIKIQGKRDVLKIFTVGK